MHRATQIIDLWFGSTDLHATPSAEVQGRWWTKDPAYDARLKAEFESDHMSAAKGEYSEWATEPAGMLALITLLDQIPRNIYRGTAHMHATDSQAVNVVRAAMAAGLDQQLGTMQRTMFLMPLMHSEQVADQWLSLKSFAAVADSATSDCARSAEQCLLFAQKHADIVYRFGRYPHRNALLGRASTVEERAFLEQPGSSF